MFEIGTLVKQDGYTGTFEVVGEWRGYAVLLSEAGTEHKAPLAELTQVLDDAAAAELVRIMSQYKLGITADGEMFDAS